MQVIVPEPYGYPPSNAHSRRSSAATTRSTKSIRDRRRSSGALSTHSQSQKPKRYIGDYIVGKTLGKGASGNLMKSILYVYKLFLKVESNWEFIKIQENKWP